MHSSNLRGRQVSTPVRLALFAVTCAASALLLQPSAHAKPNHGSKTEAQGPSSECANCGTVESVHEVKTEGKGTGLGAVGGALAGGLLGNQFGSGRGKTAMTVAGAVGGGFAGNAIEKNVRSETAYDVKVRMQDGSLRTVRESKTYAIGAKVVVDGNSLKPDTSTATE
jgi:outer membrane lipoprotein SlyB